jgi:hypothetical protein
MHGASSSPELRWDQTSNDRRDEPNVPPCLGHRHRVTGSPAESESDRVTGSGSGTVPFSRRTGGDVDNRTSDCWRLQRTKYYTKADYRRAKQQHTEWYLLEDHSAVVLLLVSSCRLRPNLGPLRLLGECTLDQSAAPLIKRISIVKTAPPQAQRMVTVHACHWQCARAERAHEGADPPLTAEVGSRGLGPPP